MATLNHTEQNTPTQAAGTRMDGARAAIAAIRKLGAISIRYNDGDDDTPEAYQAKQAATIAALTDAAGQVPPFLDGFLAAVADYIGMCETVGTPDLDNWKPDVLLTPQELEERIAELFPEHQAA